MESKPLPEIRYAYSLSIGAAPRPGVTRRIVCDRVVLFREAPGQHPRSATVAEVIGVAEPTVREIECMAGGIDLTERVAAWMAANPAMVSKRRAQAEAFERRELIAGLAEKAGKKAKR